MKLGPIQKAWVANLRAHPERQIIRALGYSTDDERRYGACCLGEGLLTLIRCSGKYTDEDTLVKNVFDSDNELVDSDGDVWDYTALICSHNELGLMTEIGGIKEPSNEYLGGVGSLAQANDNHYTWAQIADFIESHPEQLFVKSV